MCYIIEIARTRALQRKIPIICNGGISLPLKNLSNRFNRFFGRGRTVRQTRTKIDRCEGISHLCALRGIFHSRSCRPVRRMECLIRSLAHKITPIRIARVCLSHVLTLNCERTCCDLGFDCGVRCGVRKSSDSEESWGRLGFVIGLGRTPIWSAYMCVYVRNVHDYAMTSTTTTTMNTTHTRQRRPFRYTLNAGTNF